MEDYKPNSVKYNTEKKNVADKKVEKVVKNRVIVKKKTGLDKVVSVFISEDAQNVKSYILLDVLVPAIKKAIKDIVTDGVEMILYGDTGRGRRNSNASYVSYDRFSSKRDDDRRYDRTYTRNGYSYDDIIFDSRLEAEEVLASMDSLIDTYGFVSVADLYDLAGISDDNHTHNKYGWKNLHSAESVRVRDGFVLKLPKALPID